MPKFKEGDVVRVVSTRPNEPYYANANNNWIGRVGKYDEVLKTACRVIAIPATGPLDGGEQGRLFWEKDLQLLNNEYLVGDNVIINDNKDNPAGYISGFKGRKGCVYEVKVFKPDEQRYRIIVDGLGYYWCIGEHLIPQYGTAPTQLPEPKEVKGFTFKAAETTPTPSKKPLRILNQKES